MWVLLDPRAVSVSTHKIIPIFCNRIEVAGILKQMRIENIKHKYEAEEQAAHQHFKVSLVK